MPPPCLLSDMPHRDGTGLAGARIEIDGRLGDPTPGNSRSGDGFRSQRQLTRHRSCARPNIRSKNLLTQQTSLRTLSLQETYYPVS